MMEMKNILVIKLSAIGDVIHALPVSYAVKETYPEAKLTWVVEPPAYHLLTNNPYIDRVIVFEKKKFKSVRGLIGQLPSFSSVLRQEAYDAVLDLQGLFKSAAIACIAKAPVKLGCCNMREGSQWISKPVCGEHQNGHIVERYLDVAREIGCRVEKVMFPFYFTEREEKFTPELLRQAGMNPAHAYVVLAVGANWPNKRWPTEHYAKLNDWLYDQGLIPVVVGGGTVDEQLVAKLKRQSKIPPVDLVGKTNLKQLAWVIQKSKLLIGGDTGPMHLAAALKTPVIALMGPTDASRNGPYGQLENAIEIEEACRFCWKRSCALDRDCLAVILPESVKVKVLQLLS